MQKSTLNIVGIASLILSISAVIVPAIIFVIHPFTTDEGSVFFLIVLYLFQVPFYIIVVSALVTGIIARKSIFGLFGLNISLVCIGLAICGWMYFFYMLFFGLSGFRF